MKSSKKILLMSVSFYGQRTGGAEYQQYLIANELIKRGFSVYYLFINNGDSIDKKSPISLLPIKKRKILSKLLGKYYFLDAHKVFLYLKQIEPDVVIGRTGFSYIGIASRYCRSSNCKMVWHVAHENDLSKSLVDNIHFPHRFFHYVDKKFLEYGIKTANAIICQTEHQKVLLHKNYSRNSDIIIPNFHPIPNDIFIKPNQVKVVWIANYKYWKQPEIFIELSQHFIGVDGLQFIMIGRFHRKHLSNGLEDLIQQTPNLSFIGELKQQEVNNILQEAHILVNTSLYEGFPNTFIQAWMRKVPVVSLHVDPDNVLKKNRIGFHSRSFEKMVEDVERLIINNNLREEMGERAREYAIENHSIEKNVSRLVKLLLQIS